MFSPSSEKIVLGVLVACFAIQTGLMYKDDVDLQLSEQAADSFMSSRVKSVTNSGARGDSSTQTSRTLRAALMRRGSLRF
jgi:hypothetical protein